MSKQDGRKKTEDSKSGDLKIIFNGGSSTDFQRARPDLVRAFIQNECWDLVNVSPPVPVPGTDPIQYVAAAIAEDLCSELKPATDATVVQGIITAKRALRQTQYNDQLTIYAAALAAGTLTGAMHGIKVMEAEIKLEGYFTAIELERPEIEKRLLTALERYEKLNDVHNKRKASCMKVFMHCLGAEPRSHIAAELDREMYRRAWNKLNARYHVQIGGTGSVKTILEKLSQSVFNPLQESIMEHIHDMKILAMQTQGAGGAGQGIQDDLLLTYILKSVERSREKEFMKDVDHITRFNMTLAQAEEIFQRTQALIDIKEKMDHIPRDRRVGDKNKRAFLSEVQAALSVLEREKSKNEKKPQNMANWSEAKKKLKCGKCKLLGHLTINCWSDHVCQKCGKTGHIEGICKFKPVEGKDEGSKVKIAELWKKK
jgi:hypothetical protein